MNKVNRFIEGFIILLITSVMFMYCCNKCDKCTVTYKVYWPNNVKTYTVTIDEEPYLGSDRGTNFLKVGGVTGPTIIKTSVPIEIINVKKLEYE